MTWYVFLEEDTEELESVDAKALWLHQWQLVSTEEVEGDRAAADARSEELAGSYAPEPVGRFVRPGGRPERTVFRLDGGVWMVKVKYQYWEAYFRVSVGELVRFEEEVAGETEVEEPKKKGRFFGRR